MRALSIRQPYAELILRGLKTIEYRSRVTHIIGERFHIYAAKRKWPASPQRWAVTRADNIIVPRETPPAWMRELVEEFILDELPMGMIVGSAIIEKCTGGAGAYEWHLKDVERLAQPREPKNHPQPAWFNPF
jgi:hypothetical protein